MAFEKVQMRKSYSSYGIFHHIPFMITKIVLFHDPTVRDSCGFSGISVLSHCVTYQSNLISSWEINALVMSGSYIIYLL